jgi:hypothetical protein
MTYFNSLTELFTLRASASATIPLPLILLLPRLQYGTTVIKDNTPRGATIRLTTAL